MKFEEILVIATIVTGIIWAIDLMLLKNKRVQNKTNDSPEPVIVEYAKAFFPVLLIVLILRSFLAEPFLIPSASMKPSLIEGDYILVNKFTYGIRLPISGTKLININMPTRGDVIVFRHSDHKDLIKRVVGLPGDRILYKNKILFINGKAVDFAEKELIKEQNGKMLFQQTEKLGEKKHRIFIDPSQRVATYLYDEFVVPQNSYFVMGDNRDNSHDSRFWGPVSDTAIIGKAFAIWWSWDIRYWTDLLSFWKVNIRWHRIATKIE